MGAFISFADFKDPSPLLRLPIFYCLMVWKVFLGCLKRPTHNRTIWERSSSHRWFVLFMYREDLGKLLDCTGTCEFTKKSSNFESAPTVPISVLLKYWGTFLFSCHSALDFLTKCVIISQRKMEIFFSITMLFLGCSF